MTIQIINDNFSVCQITDAADVNLADPFVFVGKTDEELSLVCRTNAAPIRTIAREDGWRMLRIAGTLDFSLIGILARIASLLADAKISIFALSTYNTDYLLVKQDKLDAAVRVLQENGYKIE